MVWCFEGQKAQAWLEDIEAPHTLSGASREASYILFRYIDLTEVGKSLAEVELREPMHQTDARVLVRSGIRLLFLLELGSFILFTLEGSLV